MPHKVKVSGSRSLKKGSKKNSKKGSNSRSHKTSKKHNGMDFTSILNDMTVPKSAMANMMGPQNMQMDPNMMMQQQGMQMDPNMMMQQQAMQMDPSMMMMGKNAQNGSQENEIDPLHIQYIVPQNKNLNINNYGVSYEQLLNGSQHNGLADKFNTQNNVNNVQQRMDEMKIQ